MRPAKRQPCRMCGDYFMEHELITQPCGNWTELWCVHCEEEFRREENDEQLRYETETRT